ncbi:uncharacterized protein Z519_12465 [Cladophialophora bantiana CBS 173.52]|uniref:Ketoreductase (KR) domain-containing protein n=1 Tax=Cladophialophora bantiana (strain ATCC 10958 / CBS 173.52 / CDC B-1940 / NIH 8579) TaxID=1442370 RepID=A0A0D2H843_CLAB1|nr:uncharacterized protein Z519_12465 [Cladophialophora bantiana CBS 173.52]KIW87000.1 hypothetical protein Z519_12465 [Cladophialophora bantiana CBS 173.52]
MYSELVRMVPYAEVCHQSRYGVLWLGQWSIMNIIQGEQNQIHFSSKSKATATNSSSYVLATNANSGVGYATSQVLATTPDYDFHVITSDRSLDKVEASRTELVTSCSVTVSDISSRLSTLKLDVTDPSSIRAANAVFRR